MNINYTLITEENRDSFDRVFPLSIDFSDVRVAVGAVDDDGLILGAISYIVVNFQYNIDWLYVEEEARRQGVGSALVEQVLKSIMQSGELLPVVARYEYSEENEGLHSFFLASDYMETAYSHERYELSPKDIQNADILYGESAFQFDIKSFFDIPEKEQQNILLKLKMDQSYSIIDMDAWKKECVPELSKCIYGKDGLAGFTIAGRISDETLELSYLYGKNPLSLMALLSECASEKEKLFPEYSVIFDTLSPKAEQLAKRLFPKVKAAHIYEAQF